MPTGKARWNLPPLILHPFADASGPGKLVDASRASLILGGVIPAEEDGAQRLEERLLAGRYCELSMLYYLGKDVERWLAQCADFAERTTGLRDEGFRPESFAVLLVEDTPQEVSDKLRRWGVQEYSTIFARALGLHSVFTSLPPADLLDGDFLKYFHCFADYLFACRQQLFRYKRPDPGDFEFQLYASAEYSRLLEAEWEGS